MQKHLEKKDMDVIEKRLQYTFRDKRYLQRAFTHASYGYEHNLEDNERLEFLGDSILSFVIAYQLYKTGRNEGDMTACRQKLVSAKPLENAVLKLNIVEYLQCAQDVEQKGGKCISSLYEAIVAAMFLDSGMTEVEKFITRTLKLEEQKNENYKGQLQEFLQGLGQASANYVLLEKREVENTQQFIVEAQAQGQSAIAKGQKIRDAEQHAAKILLEKLQRNVKK